MSASCRVAGSPFPSFSHPSRHKRVPCPLRSKGRDINFVSSAFSCVLYLAASAYETSVGARLVRSARDDPELAEGESRVAKSCHKAREEFPSLRRRLVRSETEHVKRPLLHRHQRHPRLSPGIPSKIMPAGQYSESCLDLCSACGAGP
jgi:hypothetical protein